MGWTCKDDTKPGSDALAVFLQDKGSKKPRVTNHWKRLGGKLETLDDAGYSAFTWLQ